VKLKGRFSFGIMVALTTSLVLGNLAWSNPTAQAANIFSNDFENGSADNWTSTTGTWSVVEEGGNHVYYQ